MDITVNYVPNDKQKIFHSSTADECLYGGAAGGGKSYALLWEALLRGLEVKNHKALLLRRSFPELEKSLIRVSKEDFPVGVGNYKSNRRCWELINGSLIDFGYIQSDDDIYQYQCFSPETEALTEKGWKKVSDIKKDDIVATMNPDNRRLEYKPATKTYKYHYQGKMIDVYQKQGVSFQVTPNHDIWASTMRVNKLRKYKAEKLNEFFKIPQWAKWQGEAPTEDIEFKSNGNNGKKISFTPETWVKFLGWYIAEGSCWEGRYEIKISQANKKGKNIIREVLKEIKGINFHENDKGFSFNNKALYYYLNKLGLSGDKYIPQNIKKWNTDLLQLMLDALVEGDGTWYGKTGRFVTSSKKLADDVCEIAIKTGYKPTLGFVENDNPKNSPFGQKRRWHVSLTPRTKDTAVTKKISVKNINYNGPVYCITVPPYNTVLIRHRGRISWSGNSAEYEYIGFDELTQFKEKQYAYLLSRNRTTKPNVKPVMRGATNPGNIGHLWVKSRFIDPAEPYKTWKTTEELTRQFIPATVYDNPHIMDNNPEYINKLKSLPEDEKRALLHGDWNAFSGQVFKDFDHGIHVITPFGIPDMWTKYFSLDWGYAKPFACLWGAVAPDNTIYIYREYYGCREDKLDTGVEMDAREVARETLAREDELVNIRVADPATWQRRGHDGLTISDIFAQEGLPMQKGDNDRIQGKMAIHDRLRVEENDEGKKKPKIYIFDNCRHLIRTLPALPYDNRRPEDVDSDSEDHLYDALRYLLMARPIAARNKIPTRRDPVNAFTAY